MLSLRGYSRLLSVLYAQGSAPSLPYLVKGVDFFINDDNVRMRDGPDLSSKVLSMLARGTAVIPILVSDLKSAADGGGEYFWYKCVIGSDAASMGWIFGKYVTCRLATKEKEIYAFHYYGNGNEVAEIDYSFTDGVFNPYTDPEKLAGFSEF